MDHNRPNRSNSVPPKMGVVKISKHIAICKVLLESNRKTVRYVIFNKKSGDIIAEVYWNNPWRQYCFFPEPQTVWSSSYLDTVTEFLKEINITHKAKKGPQHMIQG